MQRLLPIINKLQDAFNTVGSDLLELPQIVAIGSQSSGKSSIIEGIVGYDFLPRGTGMVTKRPLIIQLICNKKGNSEIENSENIDIINETYAKFLHLPDKCFVNFKDIHDEIIRETNRVISDDKCINDEPIRLKIYSPDVVNLTLIDLPGMIKIPIGSQPLNIENRIMEITLKYIQNKNSIILAITPANIDIATCEALKLANQVDPNGDRTIICVTKLDLMDKGTSAYDLLTGKIIHVKLGIIGVVCRSQHDTDMRKCIKEAIKDEEIFLKQHYPLICQWLGTKYLVNILSKILLMHIQKCIPDLREKIQRMLNHVLSLEENIGKPINDKKFTLLNIISLFVKSYCEILSGSLPSLTTKELSGGSRIYYIYHESFNKEMNEINPLDGISRSDILTAIRNAKGMKTNLFIPEIAFEVLVKKQIQRFEIPSLACLSLVHDELISIAKLATDNVSSLKRFNILRDYIIDIFRQVLSEETSPTRDIIKGIIQSEMSYINTNHPNFNITAYQISNNIDQINMISINNSSSIQNHDNFKSLDDDRLQIQYEYLCTLINSYFHIINIKIQDSVPKLITCFLINKTMTRIHDVLVNRLFNDDLIDTLLSESADIINMRENNERLINVI